MVWTRRAPAKVNLTLHITGKRADGYHELDSIVAFPEVGDQLSFQASDNFEVKVVGPFADIVDSKQNSLVDAVHWFENWSGVSVQLAIELEKNLPVAAGIGGGTSDCAAVLHALCEIYEIDPPAPESLAVLGADVPVCFYGKTCRMRGIGEQIEPMRMGRDYGIVLINPRIAVPTKAIFASPQLSFSQPLASDFAEEMIRGHNDMQNAAIALCPQIGERLNALENTAPIITRMSGSGATCFGLYENFERAKEAEKNLQNQYPNDWICVSKIHE